jgi:hypothetical protein
MSVLEKFEGEDCWLLEEGDAVSPNAVSCRCEVGMDVVNKCEDLILKTDANKK